jgi:signal transduction histidine kinase
MNDETRQMRERLFDRIVLGLTFIGLVTVLVTSIMSGLSSPWLFRGIALMIVALVAFGLRRVSQLVVAAYVLILELIGIATGILLQTSTIGFTPYLFIPIIITAGLILSPTATIAVGILSILLVATIIALTQQLSWVTLIALVPPFSLIILASLLAVESKRYVEKLGERLLESRMLLRERTLEMMEAQERIEDLQTKIEDLKQLLLTSQGEAHQTRQMTIQKSYGLYQLIKGAIQELDTSVEELECIIDQISEKPTSKEQASLLQEVWQKIYHLNNLVVNLEDMAQLKSEQVSLNYQDVDIAHLISEVIGTTRGLARGKNVEVRYQVPENLPKLQIDPVRIRQALLYVLNNAIKYTDQGIIEVQAELNAKELLIFVSDTGIGMHREEMELIFEEFGRGSGTLAKQRQGTGLGLAISKHLVELHGGRMWVTSVLGVGSTFYIALPLEPLPAKAPTAIPVAIPEPTTMPVLAPAPLPTTTAPAPDEEETLLSPQPVTMTRPPTPAKPGFGSPVGRFSPTYIGRFGFILLGLLLIIASAVALLAAFYGPVSTQEIAGTETVSPTSVAVSLPVTETAQPAESPALAPTDTPSPTSILPTITPQPTATAIQTPTETPTSTPTNTPVVATATPVSTSTPTQAPPSPTPTSTRTSTPTLTNTPKPDEEIASGSGVQPPPARPPAKGLSFVTDQGGSQFVGLHPLGETSGTNLQAAGSIVGDSSLSWSPQGDRVVFTTKRDGNFEIYVANADGSEPLNLTRSSGYDTQPSWSPDGRRIAFTSGRGGNVDIYVMDANGSNLRQLTTGRGYEEWSVWSPDGRKIAYVSDQDGNIEIYTINVDGSNEQQITKNPADDWPVVWSPDSRSLLFSSNRDSNWNLYVVDAEGGEAQRLTNDPADEREPAWSPDGRTIAFAYNGGDNWDIYTIPAPVGSPTEIPKSAWTQFTNTPANERYPAWSP